MAAVNTCSAGAIPKRCSGNYSGNEERAVRGPLERSHGQEKSPAREERETSKIYRKYLPKRCAGEREVSRRESVRVMCSVSAERKSVSENTEMPRTERGEARVGESGEKVFHS